ncbi:MAG: hypothetical protein NZT92_12435 [Abditibacteriales bacterium]|nr:hypothetical protein [Abditibacteriales bacterium]MDW8366771.1 hypothetical protein [Abditibacteriales bacterium]
MWQNIWLIVSKPDNIPIVLMMILVAFYTTVALRLGIKNDRLRRQAASNRASSEFQQGTALQESNGAATVDIFYTPEEMKLPKRVHTFPFLVKVEFLAALVVIVFLMFWSIFLDAPLEEPANPNFTPNPSKAPWYFLGLQELLVYFDPWIAGVVLPTLIIIGLMAIPYLDSQPHKGNGYYTFAERRFAILAFLFGFIGLWVVMVVIGTFMRGPGWMWFWPWERWDPHRVVSETNVDLNQFLANITGIKALATPTASMIIGFLAITLYYALTLGGTYRYAVKKQLPDLQLGLVRFMIKYWFFWTMMAIPIKIILRLVFHIKYIWVTPWFNV